MIPFPLPSSFFSGLSYFLTFVATLRAGSRANYLFRNDGVLGQVDGPLLLPESNLFEAAYGFESVVFFSLQECMDEREGNNDLKQYENDNVTSDLDVNLSLLPTQKKEKSVLAGLTNRLVNKTKSMIESLNNGENDDIDYYSISPYATYKETNFRKDANHSVNSTTMLENDAMKYNEKKRMLITNYIANASINITQTNKDIQSSPIIHTSNINKRWKRTLSPSTWILSSRKKRKWRWIYRPWQHKKKYDPVYRKKRDDYSPGPYIYINIFSNVFVFFACILRALSFTFLCV